MSTKIVHPCHSCCPPALFHVENSSFREETGDLLDWYMEFLDPIDACSCIAYFHVQDYKNFHRKNKDV
jgi:hypothetical protein